MDKIRKLENLHVLVWLIKDYSWMMQYRPLGTIMIIPAIGISGIIAWELRKDEDFTPCLAVLCWITANSCWMANEFFDFLSLSIAQIFFVLGLIAILYYYVKRYLLT